MDVCGVPKTAEVGQPAARSMESTSPLFIRVNGENTQADCLFDAWREITSPLFEATAQGRTANYSADIAACMAGDLFVSRVAYDPMVAQRGRGHLTHGDLDYFVLQLFVEGSERLFTGTSHYLLQPQAVCLRDWRYGYTGISERNDIIGFAIPRHLLNTHGRIDASRPVVFWSLDSAAGKILAGEMTRTWERLKHASEQEAAALASSLIKLVNGMLTNLLMEESEQLRVNRAMQLTIKQYIADHLDDDALGVEVLCHRFGLSRASLYRLFQDEGGLRRYIREQRLTHCFSLLSAANSPEVKVRHIAEYWGFDNASHFHRLFKARFGIPPSEILMMSANEFRKSIWEARAIRSWAEGVSVASVR